MAVKVFTNWSPAAALVWASSGTQGGLSNVAHEICFPRARSNRWKNLEDFARRRIGAEEPRGGKVEPSAKSRLSVGGPGRPRAGVGRRARHRAGERSERPARPLYKCARRTLA